MKRNQFRHCSLFTVLCSLSLALAFFAACSSAPAYETVEGDPLNARIYTLSNGLKVYMTVNTDKPRIQTYIAVRVGGKNDPAETTGLSHYLEHLMFKGTTHFGTQDYEAEKPMLDEIEQLFETYRQTTDSLERVAIYHAIDSISYAASRLGISNEYDKLMAAIGGDGCNAYTSYDVTCYTEDIPSNQVENWAKIQGERFTNMVIRGFHTELETVYEEKNMSLTDDMGKSVEALFAALFPHHPYGQQTILGTQEHLKNPSITNIKRHYSQWYVPNNMAICMSGDFDPDEAIRIIQRNFGALKPNPQLPTLEYEPEAPITEPIVFDVLGQEAERLTLAWRMPGAGSPDADVAELVSELLSNGQAGLIDLDVIQQQRALGAGAFAYTLADYTAFLIMASPGPGQTLEQLRDILLAEVAKLREGDFDEQMLEACLNNFKLARLQRMEDNRSRADMFVDAFVNGVEWADEVARLDRMAALTKDDIVAFANKYLSANSFAAAFKRIGEDPDSQKIAKPEITPIEMNRDSVSAYLADIQSTTVAPIEPVFIDFQTDLNFLEAQAGIPVIYKHNDTNGLAQLTYVYDMGTRHDRALGLATQYVDYLGTTDMTAEEVKSEFYRLAVSYRITSDSERTYVMLSGLDENLPQAMALIEKLLADAQPDNTGIYTTLVNDLLKSRADAKLNQRVCYSRLSSYTEWGPRNPYTNVLSEAELKAIRPKDLTARIHSLNSYQHRITYYGPSEPDSLLSLIAQAHQVPAELKPVPLAQEFTQQTSNGKVYIAPYDANNIYMSQVSVRGETYDPAIEPARQMFNEYFSGGMNGIVFQEMRESRGLAYSASASFARHSRPQYAYSLVTRIATQNDKMADALSAFCEIIEQMPQSEAAFQLAKDGLLGRLRTERTIKANVIRSYLNATDLGQDNDGRRQLFEYVSNATLDDVLAFHQQWIAGRPYNYCILGNPKELDIDVLNQYGQVVFLSLKDIFGY